MGLLDRLRRPRTEVGQVLPDGAALGLPSAAPAPSARPLASVVLLAGTEDLELVGEASYQDALWRICGAAVGDRIRYGVEAVLVPETDNIHDPLAIRVDVQGWTVGYLCRDDAASYNPGLRSLMATHSAHIGLRGVIVGGGYYPDGPGRLGVWLEHNPANFGVTTAARSVPDRPVGGSMRTGFSEAWLSDAEDDSYDLSWYTTLPAGDVDAIAVLRTLLATDPDPIDRHFQFAELEARLYRSRDLYPEALAEFDQTCRMHDAEMEAICSAFRRKWQKVPLLETYKQMAIRQQKLKDWGAVQRWCERGLDLYGNDAAREDAVEDLLKRWNRALNKLEEATLGPTERGRTESASEPIIEVLLCAQCGQTFERPRARGRKPQLCPTCRD